MVIESRLTRQQFVRLAVLRHFQRAQFYVFASLAAGLTAFGIVLGRAILVPAGWVPFLVYILAGIVGAVRDGRAKDAPYFLPTRYDLTAGGVDVATSRGRSHLDWSRFEGFRKMVGCYVLILGGGAILAIPEEAVPRGQAGRLEELIRRHLGQGRKSGDRR